MLNWEIEDQKTKDHVSALKNGDNQEKIEESAKSLIENNSSEDTLKTVSYTHLTLPTILLV